MQKSIVYIYRYACGRKYINVGVCEDRKYIFMYMDVCVYSSIKRIAKGRSAEFNR